MQKASVLVTSKAVLKPPQKIIPATKPVMMTSPKLMWTGGRLRIRQKDFMRFNMRFCPSQIFVVCNRSGWRLDSWVARGTEEHLSNPNSKTVATHNGNGGCWQDYKSHH